MTEEERNERGNRILCIAVCGRQRVSDVLWMIDSSKSYISD
jgi:hypothetical protein